MPNVYFDDWGDGNGFVLFSSRKVPEYYFEKSGCRFLGIRHLGSPRQPTYYPGSHVCGMLDEVLMVFTHDIPT